MSSYKRTSFDFLKQIIEKKVRSLFKQVITTFEYKTSQVCHCIQVPWIRSYKAIEFYKRNLRINAIFPDSKENEYPDRELLWTIIETLQQETTKKIIMKAIKILIIKTRRK